jgi:hypothetical protein
MSLCHLIGLAQVRLQIRKDSLNFGKIRYACGLDCWPGCVGVSPQANTADDDCAVLKRDGLPRNKSLDNQENGWCDSHYSGLRSLRSKSFEPVHFEISFVNILSTVKGLDNHRTEFSSISPRTIADPF